MLSCIWVSQDLPFFPGSLWNFQLFTETHSGCVRVLTFSWLTDTWYYHIDSGQFGSSSWKKVEGVGCVQETLALQLEHWTRWHMHCPPGMPQLPASAGNPRKSYSNPVLKEIEWWLMSMLDSLIFACWLFSVYLDVINWAVPILVRLVSWELVSSSHISCSCPFLILLQCTCCTSCGDSYVEKCHNHMKTQNWPKESVQMHPDTWMVNNTT